MEKQRDVDYPYSLAFLKKINGLFLEGESLSNSFFYQGYNIWQFYQQPLFAEIKGFSAAKKMSAKRRPVHAFAKDIVVHTIIFLSTMLALLVLFVTRRKVLVYSIDRANGPYLRDFRLSELFEVLSKEQVSYSDIFHTVPGKATLQNLLKRKYPSLYTESFDTFFWIAARLRLIKRKDISFVDRLDLSVFDTDAERAFAAHLIKQYVRRTQLSIFRVKVLSKIFARTNLKTLFAIDDARSFNELVLACNLSNIRSYAIQHGHYTKYHVGWLKNPLFKGKFVSPDMLLVWSEYWKEELLRLGTYFDPEQIVIAGAKRKKGNSVQAHARTGGENTVLIPYEVDAPTKEIRAYMRALLACPDTHVILKLRPDMTKKEQLLKYDIVENGPNFSATFDTEEALARADIVAGVYSTFLYDAIMYNKRVIMFDTSLDFGEGIILNGLGDLVGPPGSVCARLGELMKENDKSVSQRKEKLFGSRRHSLTETLKKIVHDTSR